MGHVSPELKDSLLAPNNPYFLNFHFCFNTRECGFDGPSEELFGVNRRSMPKAGGSEQSTLMPRRSLVAISDHAGHANRRLREASAMQQVRKPKRSCDPRARGAASDSIMQGIAA
jgi:hypothetical protein